jgi:hypothetical protein
MGAATRWIKPLDLQICTRLKLHKIWAIAFNLILHNNHDAGSFLHGKPLWYAMACFKRVRHKVCLIGLEPSDWSQVRCWARAQHLLLAASLSGDWNVVFPCFRLPAFHPQI